MSYRAPALAVNFLSENFCGSPEDALVLDVACGTGWVAKQVRMKLERDFLIFASIPSSKQEDRYHSLSDF